jgi:repressor LexA
MFWENLISLCKEHNTTPNAVCKSIGLSTATATRWRSGSVPRDTTLSKIADRFGVPVSRLLENEDGIVSSSDSETQPLDRENLRMVTLYETVAAGFSAYASTDVQDYMPVYLPNPAEYEWTLCIKVKGDSMHPKIEDGDIIQVRKQEDVDSGSIAVVMVDDDDGLVKIVWKEPDGVMLQSINPQYAPMHFQGKDAQRVRIVGIVTQIIKGVNGHKVNYISKDDGKKEIMDKIDQMDAQELLELNKIYNEYMRSKEVK